jgi:hypothetical protein
VRRVDIGGHLHNIDGCPRVAIIDVADHAGSTTCANEVMASRRAHVLVTIEPPLLADLLQLALSSPELDVTVDGETEHARLWDVAVVSTWLQSPVDARHVVRIDDVADGGAAPDFESLVYAVRRLCGVC